MSPLETKPMNHLKLCSSEANVEDPVVSVAAAPHLHLVESQEIESNTSIETSNHKIVSVSPADDGLSHRRSLSCAWTASEKETLERNLEKLSISESTFLSVSERLKHKINAQEEKQAEPEKKRKLSSGSRSRGDIAHDYLSRFTSFDTVSCDVKVRCGQIVRPAEPTENY